LQRHSISLQPGRILPLALHSSLGLRNGGTRHDTYCPRASYFRWGLSGGQLEPGRHWTLDLERVRTSKEHAAWTLFSDITEQFHCSSP